ncbi:MAG: Gfo/Idh/MocA family oxidoreductase [Armatimonadetes bacterium]|nr:Gfo/Idh/MocA family oxidoreductase [Armatimonadota bacterium]
MGGKVGIGVVGAGSIGIRGALEHLCLDDVQDRIRLAAVCDPVPGRAKAAAERYGVARAYESYEELLNDDGVEAVTIGSPIGIHFEQGMQALRAGRHIHFNKTMTVTCAEADQLIEEAKRRGLKIVASPGQMLRPLNQQLRKMVKNGDFGTLAWAAAGAAFGSYHEREGCRQGQDVLSNINPAWYWRNPGGGPLYDMTVYGLHSLTGILGPAKRIVAFSGVAIKERIYDGKTYPCDADDNTVMLLDFGDNLFAFVYGTVTGVLTTFGLATLFGTKGTFNGREFNGHPLQYPGREIADAAGQGDNVLLPHVQGPHREKGEAHVFEDIMQLVDWVSEGKPSIVTAEHARHVIEIIEMGYRSAETGRSQELHTRFEIPALD